jgi:hypothetical protein
MRYLSDSFFFRPLRGSLNFQVVNPRLAPWAAFLRRFAADISDLTSRKNSDLTSRTE